jgi:hypothetical protein
MNRALKRSVLVAVVALAGANVCHALDASQVFEKVSPSVWVVRTFDANDRPVMLGSAVVIGPARLVTNCHVLAKASEVVVKRDNVMYGAKLEHADAPRDLCLLSVKGFSAPAVEMAPRESLKVGQKVYAIGNPRGLEVTLSEGLISRLRGEWSDGSHVLQTSAPVSPGSSGGGLFDEQGRLVGITTWITRDSQNLNFALPAEWIAEVPKRAEAALAKRKEAAASVVARAAPGTPPGYPASGTVWVYRLTDRANHNRTSQITVRADTVDQDFVEETVVLLGGNAPPARRTVSTHETSFLEYPLGRESVFLELAPYLLAPTAGKEPAGVMVAGGYPADTVIRPGGPTPRWVTKVVLRDWEDVKVPAGSYRALHYEVNGKKDVRPTMSTMLTEFKVNVWYSPDIRRIVKLEHQAWTYAPSPYTNDDVELLEYRPPR